MAGYNSKTGEQSKCASVVKYLLFGFNVLIWLIGGAVCAIGLWAWAEKDMFSKIGKMTSIPLDPALLFILVGAVMFIIGFTGCVGALRESKTLLLIFCVAVGGILLAEIALGVLGFFYKDWVKDKVKDQLTEMIEKYRDDADLQNMIDWVQKDWLKCCGVTTYKDWEANRYFNCTSPGSEACGVPFSCCKLSDDVIINSQCGYEVMKASYDSTRDDLIYTKGCISAGEDWFKDNLVPVAASLITIAVLQILGIAAGFYVRKNADEDHLA